MLSALVVGLVVGLNIGADDGDDKNRVATEVDCGEDRFDSVCTMQIRQAVINACVADGGVDLVDVTIRSVTFVTTGRTDTDTEVETHRCRDVR